MVGILLYFSSFLLEIEREKSNNKRDGSFTCQKVISKCTPIISQEACGAQVGSSVSSTRKSTILLGLDQHKRKTHNLKSSDNAAVSKSFGRNGAAV